MKKKTRTRIFDSLLNLVDYMTKYVYKDVKCAVNHTQIHYAHSNMQFDPFSFRKPGLVYSLVSGFVLLASLIGWLWWSPIWEDSSTIHQTESPLIISSKDVIFQVGSGGYLSIRPREPLLEEAEIKIVFDDPEIVDTIGTFTIPPASLREIFVPLHSKNGIAGHCVMSLQTKNKEIKNLYMIKVKIRVVQSVLFGYLSVALGWLYFLAWSISYYPQITKNYRRKSVVGFSLDYVFLNLMGHIFYGIFNVNLYWNTYIQKQYAKRHPRGDIPVHSNDYVFSLNAVLMMTILTIQCAIYDRGDQRVGRVNLCIIGVCCSATLFGLFSAWTGHTPWLDFLYFLSYVKVATVPVKFIPQVYIQYKLKNTDGWSIKSSQLDIVGCVASFLQMIVDAFNNDDWDGTFGNPGKMMLAFVSLFFDLIFCMQHYILYPKSQATKVPKSPLVKTESPFQGFSVGTVHKPGSIYDL
ncbi:unnamed protein product [Owenia fusiformis]|uniref:Cystinosin n=1 Tax=Owenia fusiformis TaxID=6347 RepID=A0A8S4N3U0_OWEFU|nr:unnamed protein product [Owenia fusiformis]